MLTYSSASFTLILNKNAPNAIEWLCYPKGLAQCFGVPFYDEG
jgi:hypothetical protein